MVNLDFTQIVITCITAFVCIVEAILKYRMKTQKEEPSKDDIYDILNKGIQNSVGGRSLLNHPIFTRKHLLSGIIMEIRDENVSREELFRELFAMLYEYLYNGLESLIKNVENNPIYDMVDLNKDIIKFMNEVLLGFEKDNIKFHKDEMEAVDIVKLEWINIIKSNLKDLNNICFSSVQSTVHSSCDNCKLASLHDILFILHMYFIMLETVVKTSIKSKKINEKLSGLMFHNAKL